jgi:kojibiose phosphorylase
MREHHPERLAALDAGPERLARWQDVHDRLYVPEPHRDTRLIEQFDGFFELEDIRPSDLRTRLIDPNEYWGWPNGVAVHTQVSKQPSVVQLFAVDGSTPVDVQLANYEFYEPRCAHGSSLSHSVHATVACRLAEVRPDVLDRALADFLDTASLDLNAAHRATVGGTFIGGMHTAANAGAYQTAVFGFGGVTVDGGCVAVRPALPPAWSSLTFSVIVRGQRLDVTVGHDGNVVTARPDNTAAVDVTVADREPAVLEPGGAVRW